MWYASLLEFTNHNLIKYLAHVVSVTKINRMQTRIAELSTNNIPFIISNLCALEAWAMTPGRSEAFRPRYKCSCISGKCGFVHGSMKSDSIPNSRRNAHELDTSSDADPLEPIQLEP